MLMCIFGLLLLVGFHYGLFSLFFTLKAIKMCSKELASWITFSRYLVFKDINRELTSKINFQLQQLHSRKNTQWQFLLIQMNIDKESSKKLILKKNTISKLQIFIQIQLWVLTNLFNLKRNYKNLNLRI